MVDWSSQFPIGRNRWSVFLITPGLGSWGTSESLAAYDTRTYLEFCANLFHSADAALTVTIKLATTEPASNKTKKEQEKKMKKWKGEAVAQKARRKFNQGCT